MGQLTHTLLPLGYTVPVLPELDDLTVGGLVSGVGIETSSHRYGLWQYTCVHFELVLADGTVVNCSKAESRKGQDDDDDTCAFGVEALAYSRDHMVVMTANMCDEPTGSERRKINKIGYYFKPWFY